MMTGEADLIQVERTEMVCSLHKRTALIYRYKYHNSVDGCCDKFIQEIESQLNFTQRAS